MAKINTSTAELNTPIVFFIFNRPETTAAVFNEIAKVKPAKLLVVADGPRHHKIGEVENCTLTRNVINLVDWECEVITNYADQNLGCRERVASGLKWAFEVVEEAIILEDDCLPDITFFRFSSKIFFHCHNFFNGYFFIFNKKPSHSKRCTI
jgi:hypothetical protein